MRIFQNYTIVRGFDLIYLSTYIMRSYVYDAEQFTDTGFPYILDNFHCKIVKFHSLRVQIL